MAGPLTTDAFNAHRAVTAAIAPGVLVHHVWGVDRATGEITLLGELVQGGTRDQVEITPFSVNTTSPGELFPAVYYATGFRSIGAAAWGAALPQTTSVSPLGTGGVMTAVLGPGGAVELAALDAPRNADDSISPDRISLHTAADAGSLDLVRVSSTHAEGAITCRRSPIR
jgi:hypothetical protein